MIDVDVIFFDIDGTLVDARKDIVGAVNYTRKRFGLPPKPFDEVVSYIGTGVSDLVRQGLGHEGEGHVRQALGVLTRYYLKHIADQAKLYPNVKSVLKYFKDKKKVILTNRYKRFAEAALKEFGLLHHFDLVIGGDDELCMKPSGCVVTKALKKLKVDSSKAIIVGDMSIDVETGKNSGIKTCFVTYGLGDLKDVKRLKPDYIIDDLAKLKNILR
jgi:phosphoglycolate phosphatase